MRSPLGVGSPGGTGSAINIAKMRNFVLGWACLQALRKTRMTPTPHYGTTALPVLVNAPSAPWQHWPALSCDTTRGTNPAYRYLLPPGDTIILQHHRLFAHSIVGTPPRSPALNVYPCSTRTAICAAVLHRAYTLHQAVLKHKATRARPTGEGIVIPRSTSYKFVQYIHALSCNSQNKPDEQISPRTEPSYSTITVRSKQPKGTRCRK